MVSVYLTAMAHVVARIEALDRIPLGEAGDWRPIRRALGITSVAVNAYTAAAAGDLVIEPHDELGPGSGHHEEVYIVLTGRATFTVAGEAIDAPPGTIVKVDVEDRREATAAEPDTTVLVLGGKPGAALPVSPFEHWYAADPAYQAGDYERAIAIASEGLADYPEHGTLHYQLACYEALAGHREAAIEHLEVAYANDPRAREWARGDEDLASIRDAPEFQS
jgi:tetratricopeptide (TPR) repeat protein